MVPFTFIYANQFYIGTKRTFQICLNFNSAFHYSDITGLSWRFISPTNRLFAQQRIEANNNKTSKIHIIDPCEGNTPMRDRWTPLTIDQIGGKHFHLVTSLYALETKRMLDMCECYCKSVFRSTVPELKTVSHCGRNEFQHKVRFPI